MINRTFLLSLLLLGGAQALAAPPQVTLRRVPDGGVEPQVAVDSRGKVHLIYFTGDDKAGNVFHVTTSDGGRTFSRPLRVNSEAGSAMIVGGVRGPQLAIGLDDRPLVIWTGSEAAQPTPRLSGLPLMYSRLDDRHEKFEPQRDMIPAGVGIDGGASIAADRWRNVYVVWHAPPKPDGDEESRRILIAASDDGGQTFDDPLTAADQPAKGMCACCALRAFLDQDDRLRVIYRTAHEQTNRDMCLLSFDAGLKRSDWRGLSKWSVGKCVMSTSAASGNFIAWESEDKILVSPTSRTAPLELSGKNAKHPSIAIAGDYLLIAWTQGTTSAKGGSVAWQLVDRNLKPVADAAGKADDLPAWDYPAAFATADGSFIILY